MVSDEEDILQSLVILFSTNPGERVMQPGYGCSQARHASAPRRGHAHGDARHGPQGRPLYEIKWIDLDSVDVDPKGHWRVLMVRLAYRVRSTNSRSNMVYPFHFLEATPFVR